MTEKRTLIFVWRVSEFLKFLFHSQCIIEKTQKGIRSISLINARNLWFEFQKIWAKCIFLKILHKTAAFFEFLNM